MLCIRPLFESGVYLQAMGALKWVLLGHENKCSQPKEEKHYKLFKGPSALRFEKIGALHTKNKTTLTPALHMSAHG